MQSKLAITVIGLVLSVTSVLQQSLESEDQRRLKAQAEALLQQ